MVFLKFTLSFFVRVIIFTQDYWPTIYLYQLKLYASLLISQPITCVMYWDIKRLSLNFSAFRAVGQEVWIYCFNCKEVKEVDWSWGWRHHQAWIFGQPIIHLLYSLIEPFTYRSLVVVRLCFYLGFFVYGWNCDLSPWVFIFSASQNHVSSGLLHPKKIHSLFLFRLDWYY